MRWVGLLLIATVFGAGCVVPETDGLVHFALSGAHATLSCSQCHDETLHDFVPTTCSGCHVPDEVPHFEGECSECHDEVSFRNRAVGHDFFPLDGGHDDRLCVDCHPTDDFAAADPTCAACHGSEDRPETHSDRPCEDCHVIASWPDFYVPHDFFPLAGAHDRGDVPCAECHPAGEEANADPRCGACHEPERPSGHFTTDCADCHPATVWSAGLFAHEDFFPTPHEGVSTCESCHNTGDNSVYECIECHEHRESESDSEHDDVASYEWLSTRCVYCHPTGETGSD